MTVCEKAPDEPDVMAEVLERERFVAFVGGLCDSLVHQVRLMEQCAALDAGASDRLRGDLAEVALRLTSGIQDAKLSVMNYTRGLCARPCGPVIDLEDEGDVDYLNTSVRFTRGGRLGPASRAPLPALAHEGKPRDPMLRFMNGGASPKDSQSLSATKDMSRTVSESDDERSFPGLPPVVMDVNSKPTAPRRMSLREQLNVEEELEDDNQPVGAFVNGVMNPNFSGRLGWDLLVILIVVIDAMVLPFQMAYKEGKDPDAFDESWLWITTAFFVVDMILSFLTGYTAGIKDAEPGTLVTSKRLIARNYLRSWFPIDFCSTIPFGPIANALTQDSNNQKGAQMMKVTKIVKFVRFLRLMRMLRLAKLAMIWEKVEARLGSVILKQSVALMRVILVLVGICHWNACIWWMIGDPDSILKDISATFASQDHWTTMKRERDGDFFTWKQQPQFNQYIFCFYWTLGVMRTMPSEVTPVNLVERIYVMIFMFFAFSAFAICVALITQTFFKFSERKRMFDDDMAQVRGFMRRLKHNGASERVQSSVKSFLTHLYEQRKTHAKEQSMLQYLPPNLVSQLKFERLEHYLRRMELLEKLPPKAPYYISEIAEVRDVPAGTCLCRRGRHAEACWILISGRLKAPSFDLHVHQIRNQDLYILDEEALTTTAVVVSEITVRAVTPAELIRIDKERFMQMIAEHHEFMETLNLKVDIDPGVVMADLPIPAQSQHMETVAATAASIAV